MQLSGPVDAMKVAHLEGLDPGALMAKGFQCQASIPDVVGEVEGDVLELREHSEEAF